MLAEEGKGSLRVWRYSIYRYANQEFGCVLGPASLILKLFMPS
jgi:hypothetical protein